MILQISDEKMVQFVMDGIQTIIWPLTLFIILLVFRKYFISAMSRLGSVEAGASGIKMTFDHKISEAKKLLKEIKPKATSKSIGGIQIQPKKSDSYLKLMDIRMKVDENLNQLAVKNGIDSANTSSIALCEMLKESGIITIQNAQFIHSLLDISNSADETFSNEHLKIVKELFKAIKL